MKLIIEIRGGNIVQVARHINMMGDAIVIVDRDLQDRGESPFVSLLDSHVEIFDHPVQLFPPDNNADREILDEIKALKIDF